MHAEMQRLRHAYGNKRKEFTDVGRIPGLVAALMNNDVGHIPDLVAELMNNGYQ